MAAALRSYDVTSLIRPATVLGIALGNGWFRGRLGWGGGRAYYGDELAAFAQLEIEFADGHVQPVVTDDSWTAGPVSGRWPTTSTTARRSTRG